MCYLFLDELFGYRLRPHPSISLQQLQQKSVATLLDKKEPSLSASQSNPIDSAAPPASQSEAPKPIEEKTCLICRGTVNQYVVFPNCKIPHIYCVPCAENMLSAPQPRQPYSYHPVPPPSSRKSIRCVLCQSQNPLDDRGLEAFKRVVPKSSESFSTGHCDRHKDMMILYYCFDCVESACVKCAPMHSRHRFDTLESAIGQAKNSMASSVNQLVDTQSALLDYRASIEKEREKVLKEGAQRREELVSQLQRIRDLLAAAEVKLLKGIQDVEAQKLHSLNSEVNWADEKEHLTEESIKHVSDLMDIDGPLPFFKKLTDCDGTLREAKCISVKKPPSRPPNASLFPPLPTQHIIRSLSSISYKDAPYHYHYDPQNAAAYPPYPGGGYGAYDPQENQGSADSGEDDEMMDGDAGDYF